MRSNYLVNAGRALIAWLIGILVFLLTVALVAGRLPSWRQILTTAQITSVAFLVTWLLICLPFFALQRRLAIPVPLGVSGALVGLVPFLVTSYLFEAFEYGAASLLRDPMTWLWLVMFMTMCGTVGAIEDLRSPGGRSLRSRGFCQRPPP